MLLDVIEVDGELELVVETDQTVVGVVGVGSARSSHGRRTTVLRDLPVSGRPTKLRWRKRLWRGHEDLCPSGTWTERHAAIAPRALYTERAHAEVCRRVGQDGDTVAAVARDFGVGWQTAMRAVIEHGQPLITTRRGWIA